MLASESGVSQLAQAGVKVNWKSWAPATAGAAPLCADKRRADTAGMLAAQPELRDFPSYLLGYYQDLGETAPDTVTVVKAGVISAAVSWLEGKNELQTVHATPIAWGRPWFDSVSVLGGAQGRTTWYAQLRLMFWAGSKQLAFVRWYQASKDGQDRLRTDTLTKYGCRSVEWEKVGGQPRYGIIDFQTDPQSREFIVPDFARGVGSFHVSVFKWNRGEPDKDGFCNGAPASDDEGGSDGSYESDGSDSE